MTRRARSRLGLAAAALLSLLVASPAAAKSYSLPDAAVQVAVQPDGRAADARSKRAYELAEKGLAELDARRGQGRCTNS